jgi:large subunit ribosomal protein L4
MEAPKTKEFVAFLKGFDMLNKKTLLVLNERNDNIYLSSRNLQKVKVVNSASLNTYDILNAHKIIVAESSLKTIHELLGK